MAVDYTKWTALLALLKTGKPHVAEYLKVEWPTGTKYYASSAYAHTSPYRNIKTYTGGSTIEPRIMGAPFRKFEINGDIRTENIDIEFDDSTITGFSAAGSLRSALNTYGSARCELFYYYPQVDLNVSVWWGQILKPSEDGDLTVRTILTNGYRSKELFLPNRPMPKECTSTYGTKLDALDKIATNICPVDIHLGGSTGVAGFTDCPRLTSNDCNTRLGTKKYYPGMDFTAIDPFQSGSHQGEVAIAKSNAMVRAKPVVWIFGTKHIRNSDILISSRMPNTQHPDDAWIGLLVRVGEGPVVSIANLKVNGKLTDLGHYRRTLGERGQSSIDYPGDASHQTLSGTALIYIVHGYVDPNVVAANLEIEYDVVGFNQVAVYTDPTTFTRKFSDDRVWCLIEMYTNQKCGLKYDIGRFSIDDALTTSEWGRLSSTFVLTLPDGETKTCTGRRTTFDAAVEGRPAIEVIQDVCRSGRISIPFQNDGKYSIRPIRAFTSEELGNAVVFTDHGVNRNISFEGSKAVDFSYTPDDKLINEITLTFEEQNNFDIARPIVGNDPDQQYAASKILGNDALSVVPSQMTGFGVRQEQEAIKLLYYLLWFGEGDSGGTKNNCFARFPVPFEWTLGLKRYDPFKLDLTTQTIPTGPTGRAQVETATAAGTVSGSGNMNVTITAAEFTTPIVVPVAVTSGNTPAVWVKKVQAQLRLTSQVNSLFFIRVNGTSLILTKRFRGANDTTLNIAFATGTATGITAAPVSSNMTTGIADSPFQVFRCLGIKKIDDNLAEIFGVAYNQTAYEAFEEEDPDPAAPGFCTIDAECPDGFVCRGGVCVPVGQGPICNPGAASATYNGASGLIEVTVPDC